MERLKLLGVIALCATLAPGAAASARGGGHGGGGHGGGGGHFGGGGGFHGGGHFGGGGGFHGGVGHFRAAGGFHAPRPSRPAPASMAVNSIMPDSGIATATHLLTAGVLALAAP